MHNQTYKSSAILWTISIVMLITSSIPQRTYGMPLSDISNKLIAYCRASKTKINSGAKKIRAHCNDFTYGKPLQRMLEEFIENKDKKPISYFIDKFAEHISNSRTYCAQKLKPEVPNKEEKIEILIEKLHFLSSELSKKTTIRNKNLAKGSKIVLIFNTLEEFKDIVIDEGKNQFFELKDQLYRALDVSLSV